MSKKNPPAKHNQNKAAAKPAVKVVSKPAVKTASKPHTSQKSNDWYYAKVKGKNIYVTNNHPHLFQGERSKATLFNAKDIEHIIATATYQGQPLEKDKA